MHMIYNIYIFKCNIIYLSGKTNLNFKVKTSNCELIRREMK